MEHTLQTERVPWNDLRPHARNPRNGDIDAIADSLRVNGQYKPIVVAMDGTILAGNHTYMAAGQLGWKYMSVVRLDVDPNSDEALRILLVDNRTSDLAKYDDGVLQDLLQYLNEEAAQGLLGTGYDDEAFRKLIGDIQHQEFRDVFDDLGKPTVVVTCEDESAQESLIAELLDRGLDVKGMWV